MMVRPADGSGCHLDKCISRIDDFRIGYGIHPDIMCSMPRHCAHDASPLICQAVSRRLTGLASSPVSISILTRFISRRASMEIGREWYRERVCQYVWMSVYAETLQTNRTNLPKKHRI